MGSMNLSSFMSCLSIMHFSHALTTVRASVWQVSVSWCLQLRSAIRSGKDYHNARYSMHTTSSPARNTIVDSRQSCIANSVRRKSKCSNGSSAYTRGRHECCTLVAPTQHQFFPLPLASSMLRSRKLRPHTETGFPPVRACTRHKTELLDCFKKSGVC
jgi:hypothetical protein